MEQKFFICEHCGNIIMYMKNVGVPVKCCGQEMKELNPNMTDGASEKHLPIIKQNGNKVSVLVGETLHPMTQEHNITWIFLQTDSGSQIKWISSKTEPQAEFVISDDEEVMFAYAFCNLHGLWKAHFEK